MPLEKEGKHRVEFALWAPPPKKAKEEKHSSIFLRRMPLLATSLAARTPKCFSFPPIFHRRTTTTHGKGGERKILLVRLFSPSTE